MATRRNFSGDATEVVVDATRLRELRAPGAADIWDVVEGLCYRWLSTTPLKGFWTRGGADFGDGGATVEFLFSNRALADAFAEEFGHAEPMFVFVKKTEDGVIPIAGHEHEPGPSCGLRDVPAASPSGMHWNPLWPADDRRTVVVEYAAVDGVLVASSRDVPGFVAEETTPEALEKAAEAVVPPMLGVAAGNVLIVVREARAF
jgi:hypothetical protein